MAKCILEFSVLDAKKFAEWNICVGGSVGWNLGRDPSDADSVET